MSLYAYVVSALTALGVEPDDLQIATASLLAQRHHPNLSTDRPALVGPLRDCAGLCTVLLHAYPEDHPVTVVHGVDREEPWTEARPLAALRETSIDASLAVLYLPPVACPGAVETFYDTVAHLRAPDGCPWDREQTHRSLRQGFQEEAYEMLDALDRGDTALLQEELGDVLLHILLQAQIATERGEFRLCDVICGANAKIVRRHPHVFADLAVTGIDEVLVNWKEIKQREKAERVAKPSSLDGVSTAMPALARAQSIQRHVDCTGMLSETVSELVARARRALAALANPAEQVDTERALGDLFFDLADLARKLGIDAESALRESSVRFERRYRELEGTLDELTDRASRV